MAVLETEVQTLTERLRAFMDAYEGSDRTADFINAFMLTIPSEEYEAMLRDALRRVVPIVDGQERGKSVGRVFSQSAHTIAKSTKGDLLRNRYWKNFLSQSIPTASGRKTLGKATSADLFYAADTRTAHAAATLVEAEKWQRLGELLLESGAEHLEDLALEDVQAVLV